MEMNRETLYNGLNLMYIGELAAIIGLFVGLLILFLPGAVGLSLLILLAGIRIEAAQRPGQHNLVRNDI